MIVELKAEKTEEKKKENKGKNGTICFPAGSIFLLSGYHLE